MVSSHIAFYIFNLIYTIHFKSKSNYKGMSAFLHQHTYKTTLFYIYTLCFLSVTVNEMTMVPSIPNPMTCSADHFLSSLPKDDL